MTHTITYNPEIFTLEIKCQGDIVLNEIKEIYIESTQVVKEHNCRLVFSDYSEATIKLSTMEIYDLPKMLSSILSPSEIPVYELRRALVVAKDLEDYHFFETVSSNRGQHTKIFQDVAEARRWLSNK